MANNYNDEKTEYTKELITELSSNEDGIYEDHNNEHYDEPEHQKIEQVSTNKNTNIKRIIIIGAVLFIVFGVIAYFIMGDDEQPPAPRHDPRPEVQQPVELEHKIPEQNKLNLEVPDLTNSGDVLKDFNYDQTSNSNIDNLNINSYDENDKSIAEENTSPIEQQNVQNEIIKPVESVPAPTPILNEHQNEILSLVKENNKLLLEINDKLNSLDKLNQLDKLDNLNKLDSNDQEIKKLINDAIDEFKSKECPLNNANNAKQTVAPVKKETNYVKKAEPVKKAVKVKKKVSNDKNGMLGNTYSLKSIMVGRVWISLPNGVIESFGIGDYLPNGTRIGNIDPDNGVFDTTGKLIIK